MGAAIVHDGGRRSYVLSWKRGVPQPRHGHHGRRIEHPDSPVPGRSAGICNVPMTRVTVGRCTPRMRRESPASGEIPGAHAILCLQQPPAGALPHVIQRVAPRTVHDLQKVGPTVQRQDVVKRSRRGALCEEVVSGHRRVTVHHHRSAAGNGGGCAAGGILAPATDRRTGRSGCGIVIPARGRV